jgi:hypothetical protein
MSESVYWLSKQLKGKATFRVIDANCGELTTATDKLVLYCPTTQEYEITVEVVKKAIARNATLLPYPVGWCRASREAIEYGKTHNIRVLAMGAFFDEYIEQKS